MVLWSVFIGGGGGGGGGAPPPPILVPTYLLVTGDCYYTGLTGAKIRRRTYEVLDQNFQPMGNGIAVEENISNVTPSGNISGGGMWTTGENGEAPTGSFYDFYSNGSNTSPSNALQNYFAVAGGVADLPLTVLEPSNNSGNPATYLRYGTQGVYYTSTGVKIDGYYYNPIIAGPNDPPCPPPTPGLP